MIEAISVSGNFSTVATTSEKVKQYCFLKVSQWSPSTFSERHEGHNGWLALRETHFDEGD